MAALCFYTQMRVGLCVDFSIEYITTFMESMCVRVCGVCVFFFINFVVKLFFYSPKKKTSKTPKYW